MCLGPPAPYLQLLDSRCWGQQTPLLFKGVLASNGVLSDSWIISYMCILPQKSSAPCSSSAPETAKGRICLQGFSSANCFDSLCKILLPTSVVKTCSEENPALCDVFRPEHCRHSSRTDKESEIWHYWGFFIVVVKEKPCSILLFFKKINSYLGGTGENKP